MRTSSVAKGAFTARNTPSAQVAAGTTGKGGVSVSSVYVHAGIVPLDRYAEIAAMPGFPEAPGWRIIIIPLKAPTKTAGGIHLTDEEMWSNEVLCDIGYVAHVGSQAYKDPRFGGEAWCKVGDFVNYGRLSGKDTIFRDPTGKDKEQHRIHVCNDRDVIMVLPNPHAIKVFT